MRRSCCDVSLAGFLMACASSSTTRSHATSAMRVDVAHRGAVGGDRRRRRRRPRPRSRRATARFAPWCTTTRRSGVKRAASAVQLPTTAGGAITSAGPVAGAREQVGEHRRRLAETHVEREATAEPGRVEEAEPRERLGLVAAQLADEARRARRPARRRRRRRPRAGRRPSRRRRSRCRPRAASPRGRARGAASRRPTAACVVARSASAAAAALRSALVDRDPAAAGADERAGFLGQPRDVGGGELDVVEHRRPAHVGELVGADGRRRRRVGEHAQRRRRLAARQRGHPHVEARRPRAADRSTVISSHASSWLEHHLAAAGAAGPPQRGQHPFEARRSRLRCRARFEPPSTIACSIGIELAARARRRAPRGATRRRRRAGRAARSARACSPVTERAHCSTRADDLAADARPARRTRCRRAGRGTPRRRRSRCGRAAAARAPRAGARCRGRSRRPCR